jgi:hypothetical protein
MDEAKADEGRQAVSRKGPAVRPGKHANYTTRPQTMAKGREEKESQLP